MRWNRKTKFWGILFLLVIILSLIGPFMAPEDPNTTNVSLSNQPPSLDHWFGTDQFGRDVLSRTLTAARISIGNAFLIVIASAVIGILLGVLAGYLGGAWDSVIMTITDMFLVFPQLVIAIGIAGILGGGLANASLALILSNWMSYARLARSSTLREKKKDYVAAAKFAGLNKLEIILKHILPNIRDILLTTFIINFASMLMSLSSLSFLGIGAQPPTAEWGAMITEGRSQLAQAPWQILAPSLAIILVVLIFNQFGRCLHLQSRENN